MPWEAQRLEVRSTCTMYEVRCTMHDRLIAWLAMNFKKSSVDIGMATDLQDSKRDTLSVRRTSYTVQCTPDFVPRTSKSLLSILPLCLHLMCFYYDLCCRLLSAASSAQSV